jgi:hypothetical protein
MGLLLELEVRGQVDTLPFPFSFRKRYAWFYESVKRRSPCSPFPYQEPPGKTDDSGGKGFPGGENPFLSPVTEITTGPDIIFHRERYDKKG